MFRFIISAYSIINFKLRV